MLGVFAEFETNLRRERQAEGIAAAKARGVYKGGKPRIDPEAVRKLAADGIRPAHIARYRLSVPANVGSEPERALVIAGRPSAWCRDRCRSVLSISCSTRSTDDISPTSSGSSARRVAASIAAGATSNAYSTWGTDDGGIGSVSAGATCGAAGSPSMRRGARHGRWSPNRSAACCRSASAGLDA